MRWLKLLNGKNFQRSLKDGLIKLKGRVIKIEPKWLDFEKNQKFRIFNDSVILLIQGVLWFLMRIFQTISEIVLSLVI